MKILVVGASTFLGGPLAESLATAGHEISVLHPDPRRVDSTWFRRFQCHFGPCREGHVLHEALQGVERVVACLAAAGQGELEETRDLAQAAKLHSVGSLVKLSTPAPLRNAAWNPMRVRRHADQILDGSEASSCVAEVGWIGESLRSLTRRQTLWLPHPLSCPGRLRWQSQRMAVQRLSELVQKDSLPRKVRIQGADHATLAELSSRLIAEHAGLERVFLPGRCFRWLEKWSPRNAFVGCRLVHGAIESDPPPPPGSPKEDALEDW